MSDWQSMETAPRDGTVIRVKNDQMQEPVQAAFGTYYSAVTRRAYPDHWVVEKEECRFPSGLRGHFVIPTLWQPV